MKLGEVRSTLKWLEEIVAHADSIRNDVKGINVGFWAGEIREKARRAHRMLDSSLDKAEVKL